LVEEVVEVEEEEEEEREDKPRIKAEIIFCLIFSAV
jgi:hypothetical protein